MAGSASPLPAGSVLLDLVRSASAEFRVNLGKTSAVARLLPPQDRDWLAAWNVHTDDAGTVTPESKLFDDLVRAILTHPEY